MRTIISNNNLGAYRVVVCKTVTVEVAKLVVVKVVVLLATTVVMPRNEVQNGPAWFVWRRPIHIATSTA